jgi:hypothetical protein
LRANGMELKRERNREEKSREKENTDKKEEK